MVRIKEDAMKKRILVLGAMLILAVTMMTGCVKVVKIGEEGKYTGNVEFNAGDDVAKIWESAALPEMTEKAVELNTFLTEAKGDLKSLADKYGKYSMGTTGELNYVVKGTGTVEEVDTKSKVGFIKVKLEGYTGPETVKIQIGPVYKGSAIRDSLSFIKFGDYTNQEEWAAVSQGINKVVAESVVTPAKPETLQGKNISFIGAFTVSDNTQVLITPSVLETK